MKIRITPLLAILLISTGSYAQQTLCMGDNAVAEYNMSMEGVNLQGDVWKLTVNIKNLTTDALYYARDNKYIIQEGNQLFPFYLKIWINNAVKKNTEGTYYMHGSPTLKMGTDTTTLFKIDPVRIDKSWHVTVPTGERPLAECNFTAILLPLDEISLRSKRKKSKQ